MQHQSQQMVPELYMNVVPKIGVGMGGFDGTGDYLIVPSSPEFSFGTSASWTIEMWA